jgi:hypothetical protein
MNYIDKEIIEKEVGFDVSIINIRDVLYYASLVEKCDFYLSYIDYIDLLKSLGDIANLAGSRDKEDRPMFQIGGIRFYAISKEEVDKYRVLK